MLYQQKGCLQDGCSLAQVLNESCPALHYHSLIGVIRLRGLVQELAVLHFFTEVLQCVEWFVELHRHGDLGQVFANVVSQDIPQVNVTGVRARSRQARAAAVPEGTSCELPIQDWQGKKYSE